jgi:hypothetical protein
MNLLELQYTLMNIALLEDQQGDQFNGLETNMQWIHLPSRKASNSSKSPKEATETVNMTWAVIAFLVIICLDPHTDNHLQTYPLCTSFSCKQ